MNDYVSLDFEELVKAGKLDPEPPEEATSSGSDCLESMQDTMEIFFYIIKTTKRSDYMDHLALRAKEVLEGRELPELISEDELVISKPGRNIKFLRSVSAILLQMMLCRCVDSFETYLSEITREVLNAKPQLLRSQEQIRVDYVLQFETIDDLRVDLIDRKVNELGYQGFSALEKWFQERMGIDLVDDPDLKPVLIEMIETRNIIVHNRSKVGSKYLKNVLASEFKKGDTRELSVDYLLKAFAILNTVTVRLDKKLGAKFLLPLTSKVKKTNQDTESNNEIDE